MTNRQPYTFEGGVEERTHLELYRHPPSSMYADCSELGEVLAIKLEDLIGFDEPIFALENDSGM